MNVAQVVFSMENNILEVRNLVKHFEVSKSLLSRNKKIVKAVDGISFDTVSYTHLRAHET